MRIIQVMPEFGLAGAEIMAENLAYGLRSKGHEVLIISFYNMHTAITERLEENGIRIEYLGKKKGFDSSIVLKMRKIMKVFQPDIIQTHRYVLPYVFLSSIGMKVKRVHTVHNIAEKEVPRKQLPLQKILIEKFGVIPVAITPITKKSIEEYYGLNDNKVPLIYNGIDLTRCIPKKNTQITGTAKVLHVGRFAPQKNHIMMVEAFADVVKKYPTCELDLVGDGDLVESVKQRVNELGIEENVRFIGLLDMVYKKMSESDIFILPSNYEGMPITLIEAMTTGLPIVATAVGGVPDMIEDEKSGLLVAVSKDKIAKDIIKVLDNEKKKKKVSQGAMLKARDFSLEKMTQAYITLYQQ